MGIGVPRCSRAHFCVAPGTGSIGTTTDDTGTFLNSEDVPAASLTAGAYVIPDGEIVNHLGHVLWVAGLGPSGQPGTAVKAGTVSLDAPYFVDGRQHAKENLIFFLRAAGLWQPYWAGDYRDCMSAGCRFDSGTNCVVSGFIERAIEGKWYSDPQSFVALQNLWPFVVNYHLRNAVYDPTVAPPGPGAGCSNGTPTSPLSRLRRC